MANKLTFWILVATFCAVYTIKTACDGDVALSAIMMFNAMIASANFGAMAVRRRLAVR